MYYGTEDTPQRSICGQRIVMRYEIWAETALSSSRLTIEIVICDIGANGERPRWQFIRGVSSMRRVRPAWERTTTLRLPLLSRYTSCGGGGPRVGGRVTPEVIRRSGQRAAIVNETHRSHQMLTFDWRPGSWPAGFCVRRSRHLVCCVLPGHVTASACRRRRRWHFPQYGTALLPCFCKEAVISCYALLCLASLTGPFHNVRHTQTSLNCHKTIGFYSSEIRTS